MEKNFKITYHHVIHILVPSIQSLHQLTLCDYGVKEVSLSDLSLNKPLIYNVYMKSMVLFSFTLNLWVWYEDRLCKECRSKFDLYTAAKKIWIIHQLFISKG